MEALLGMFKLNQQLIAELTNYMFVNDRQLQADVTIVLGNTLWHRPLLRAIDLYQTDQSSNFIFCGGFNQKLGFSESMAMQQEWLKRDFPSDRVSIDDQSINTYENMVNAKNILAKNKLLRPDIAINLISINYHMRRSVETCFHVFGNQIDLGPINYPSQFCDRHGWHENKIGNQLIISEAIKIKRYLPATKMPKLIDHFLGQHL